jgi:hypothetical protein
MLYLEDARDDARAPWADSLLENLSSSRAVSRLTDVAAGTFAYDSKPSEPLHYSGARNLPGFSLEALQLDSSHRSSVSMH